MARYRPEPPRTRLARIAPLHRRPRHVRNPHRSRLVPPHHADPHHADPAPRERRVGSGPRGPAARAGARSTTRPRRAASNAAAPATGPRGHPRARRAAGRGAGARAEPVQVCHAGVACATMVCLFPASHGGDARLPLSPVSTNASPFGPPAAKPDAPPRRVIATEPRGSVFCVCIQRWFAGVVVRLRLEE